MTRKKADLPLQKVTLNLFAGDMERLQAVYPRLGASTVIRDLVHAHLRRIEEKALSHIPAMAEKEKQLMETLDEPDFRAI